MVLDGALATELERRGADLPRSAVVGEDVARAPEMIQQYTSITFWRAPKSRPPRPIRRHSRALPGAARAGAARTPDARGGLARSEARAVFCASRPRIAAIVRPLVAASVGPYGAMRADGSEYRGRYGLSDRELADFHRPRLEVLAGSGADVLAFETLPCLREALVLADSSTNTPASARGLAFPAATARTTARARTSGAARRRLPSIPRIAAIGVNCTAPAHVTALLQRMREPTASRWWPTPIGGTLRRA